MSLTESQRIGVYHSPPRKSARHEVPQPRASTEKYRCTLKLPLLLG
jgi:hypothetical protein